MRFKGDVIITDPCYIMKDNSEPDDWYKSDFGKNLNILGFTKFLTSRTIYGDWTCTTFKDCEESMDAIDELIGVFKFEDKSLAKLEKMRKKILKKHNDVILGSFTADSGTVSVMLLEDVLRYNPDFDYHITKPRTTTWLKNFDGKIKICRMRNARNQKYIKIEGKGNINFFTAQTGF